GVKTAHLAQRDELFRDWPHLFGFLHRGGDALVFKQRCAQIPQQRDAMGSRSSQFSTMDPMPHVNLSPCSIQKNQLPAAAGTGWPASSSVIPKLSPMPDRISLI